MKMHINHMVLPWARERLRRALVRTGEDVINDIVEADIVPFALGTMERTLRPLDVSEINNLTIRIHSDTPYARRLYFHPEYNFHREPWAGGEGNPNAQAYWFEPWINGARSGFVKDCMAYHLKEKE